MVAVVVVLVVGTQVGEMDRWTAQPVTGMPPRRVLSLSGHSPPLLLGLDNGRPTQGRILVLKVDIT